MTDRQSLAAVIGAGPSGFYATDQLLDAGFDVDLLDALPTPFGLVRAGVAPDHPKIKSVTRVYDTIAARPGFRFFGGVELGADITRADLLLHYHAIVVPFDDRHGLIRNVGGRVCDEESRSQRGEYVVGWIKRGPSGVIGTNKKDAAATVAKIIEDAEAGVLNEPADAAPEAVAALIAQRVPATVEWDGWCAIDACECGAGEPLGRPRVKLARRAELYAAATATARPTELTSDLL
jgi:NADPH-dependent glutamate synthase beta subunit-like oxidoreductase